MGRLPCCVFCICLICPTISRSALLSLTHCSERSNTATRSRCLSRWNLKKETIYFSTNEMLLCSCVLVFLRSCALVLLWGQNAGSANCQEKYCHVPILKHNNAHCAWNRKGSEPSPNTSPLCKAIHKKKYNWLQKYSLSDQQVPYLT